MPKFDHPDDTESSQSWDEYEYHQQQQHQPPRKPRPALTKSYSNERSRQYATNSRDNYRSDRTGREVSQSRERRPTSSSNAERRSSRRDSRTRNADREERRRERAARDPEREARREERRAARRASKRDQAAYGPEQEARRSERRAARRAERHASRCAEQEQEQERYAVEPPHGVGSGSPQRDAQRSGLPDYPSEPGRIVNDPYVHESPADWERAREKDAAYEHSYSPARDHENRNLQRQSSRPPPGRLARGESWQTSPDDWDVDLERSSIDEKKHNSSQSSSTYDELDYFKRRRLPRAYEQRDDDRRCCCGGGRKCVIGVVIATIIILIIIIAVPVAVSRNKFSYTPLTVKINNTAAFTSGGATTSSVNTTNDGIGAGTDSYTYYQGHAANFPNNSLWVSFEDMWNNNLPNIQQACGWLDYGADDSKDEIQDIYNAIQDRANASLVDHRFILAIVLQESHGCVRVSHTTSSGGVKNTGLMQAHNGHEYNSHFKQKSIMLMVQDGTQGTKHGDGLVQLLNVYGDPYEAARGYNSGYIPTSGDLSEAAGATACYVSDVANRLTGWVQATSKCPTDS